MKFAIAAACLVIIGSASSRAAPLSSEQALSQADLDAQTQSQQQQDFQPPPPPQSEPERVLVEPAQRVGQPMRPPREVRTGAADMVLQSVEQSVSREEVAAAVQAMIAAAPVCTSWPAVWLQGNDRWSAFLVRYDLMTRDWGPEIASVDQERMEEFVTMGFLTRRERPEIGPGVVAYTLTPDGRAALRGSPYGGDRPTFCGPAQRRLLEITEMNFGRFPCGSLQVRFTHVSDGWPTWASAERTRARLAETWPAPGTAAEGSVSMNRQWFRPNAMPRGAGRNGALRSVCFDADHERTIGDDLNLFDAEQPAIPEDGQLNQ
jgi:hypothetical protein